MGIGDEDDDEGTGDRNKGGGETAGVGVVVSIGLKEGVTGMGGTVVVGGLYAFGAGVTVLSGGRDLEVVVVSWDFLRVTGVSKDGLTSLLTTLTTAANCSASFWTSAPPRRPGPKGPPPLLSSKRRRDN